MGAIERKRDPRVLSKIVQAVKVFYEYPLLYQLEDH